ncbi:MAG TPA: S8 family serine peptidase [Gammaproteobacteria bacterium]|nr:S8 family serine peptidase [Gammaproteobacteria bacterium]
MRSLSLALVLAASAFIGFDLAQASYLGEPFHAVHPLLKGSKMDRSARPAPLYADSMAYYIVRLKEAPAALYTGGISGYAATSARANGRRTLDAFAPSTHAYVSYLQSRQSELLMNAESALNRRLSPRYTYSYALNGMSLQLTRAEASRLAQLDDVVSVEPVRYYKPVTGVGDPASASDTNASRAWVNAPGVWVLGSEGEGIVVADVDTGINDANSSFAATGPLDGYVAANPLGTGNFLGVCDPSNTSQHSKKPSFFACNDKLIGAYTYTNGANDPDSPEDSEGHGSHTASTMVGDFLSVPVNGVNTPLSGVAPHASLIVYDVCDPKDQCATDKSVQAVDQAIQDQAALKSANQGFKGMVLNYSIGGGGDPYNDSVEQAFLSAVEAGIFVAAAAGNGGPANVVDNDPVNFPVYPVEHLGPWVASVAAATHSGTLTPNNVENFAGGDSVSRPSASMSGVSNTAGIGPADVIYAGAASFVGDDPVIGGTAPTSNTAYPASQGAAANAQQCLYPFSPGTFTGNPIVVCDRGTNPLVDKAYNVEQGGAAGVIIADTATSKQDSPVQSYVIPGTLISQTDGDNLRAWLAASVTAAQAQLSGATLTTDASQADQLAGFSSRGPTDTAFDNLVKPDLTAPGMSVLAALSNPVYTASITGGSNAPETFGFLDGTSMATPHVTAAAGLLMALHPSWTPAEIRSALMLTAVTGANGASPGLSDQCASLDSGSNCVASSSLPSPQVRGAGRIDAEAASRAGLLLDENGTDYTDANPDNNGDLAALNLPSMANASCVGNCSWSRTLSSAFTATTVSYSVSVSGVSNGLKLSVSPQSFSLAPGHTQALKVSADATGVAGGTWAFAEVDITTGDTGDGGKAIPAMHLPIALLSTAPAPHMSISPTSLSVSVAPGASTTEQFTINNGGQIGLSWKAASVSESSALASVATILPGSRGALSTSTVWDQEPTGSGSGFASDFHIPDGHGIYVADHFTLPVKAELSKFVADGFAQDSSGPVAITGTVNWYIYTDKSGQPTGEPEDGKSDYAWHYSADATAAGVGVNGGTITLDLATAKQPDAMLAAGSYWLIVAPSFNSRAGDSNGAAWFWFEGKSSNDAALVIDSADLLGGGTGWQAADASLAFTLFGSLDCSGSTLTGLTLNPASGVVASGGSATVTATFNAGRQAAGSNTGAVCVSGNASDNPVIALPVTANVSGSSGGGGGGGGFDWLALAGLAWVTRRRLNRHH